MLKVHIASSRQKEIGDRCRQWASFEDLGKIHWTTPEDCEVFVSVLYDTILTPEFIKGRRCYNFHPGILPDYRGAGVYSWVLINGEKETGITLHEIDADIDHGPILDVRSFAILPHDTAGRLFEHSMDLLFQMFVEWFPRLLSGEYTKRANLGGRLYLRSELEEAKDLTGLIRGFTFEGKEPAFWCDSRGEKHYITWE